MIAPIKSTKKERNFDPKEFLATSGEGRRLVLVARKQTIYAQGGVCDAVFYIKKGSVKLSVVSAMGKEATFALASEGDFFGECGLAGLPSRTGSATAMADCELMRIDTKAMMIALRQEPSLRDMFTNFLLGRNIRYQQDLVDQIFNSSEKRLARTLLLMARFDKEGLRETAIPNISQEALAEMVGTTRSRVSFFMNKFRKLGFIDYGGDGMRVRGPLLNGIVPHLTTDAGRSMR
jgi:CRP-like cAMP-binding protein